MSELSWFAREVLLIIAMGVGIGLAVSLILFGPILAYIACATPRSRY